MIRETKRAFPKLLSCLLAAALITAIVPLGTIPARAASAPTTLNIADGSIVIGSNSLTVGGVTQTPNADSVYRVTGSSTTHNVHVTGGTATIELDNASIQGGRAFYLDAGADVTLLLSGTNTVESSSGWAGIEVPSGASLTIDKANAADADSADTLTVKADDISGNTGGGAGIGGKSSNGPGETCGAVIINGGTVKATGGGYNGSGGNVLGGAGIGGGGGYGTGDSCGRGGSVTIGGGTVKATGGGYYGIGGGGGNGIAGTTVITGGSVNAGIQGTPTNGSAHNSQALFFTTVTLQNGAAATGVTSLATGTSYYGANGVYTDSSGSLYLWLPSGAAVTAAETATLHYSGSVSAGTSGTLGTATPRPEITSVSVPASGVYGAGKNLDFIVSFDGAVTVNSADGTPYLPLTVGGSTVRAGYLSGSGTSSLTFRYTAASGDNDADGVALSSAITLNGGAIQSAVGANAQLVCNGIAPTSGVLVDAVAPTVTAVAPSGANVPIGTGSLSVTFSKTMDTTVGSITLNNAQLANPSWDTAHKIVTYMLSGLLGNTVYNVSASGFRDTAGNAMAAYTGTSFSTVPKNLTYAMIADIAAQTYTGSAIKPAITVTDGAKTLTEGTDYIVAYSGNTAAGTATVVVMGCGSSYSGTVAKPFIINPKAIMLTLTANSQGGANAGADVTLTAAVAGAVELPQGTVTFRDGSTVIAQDVPIIGSNGDYSAQTTWRNVSDGSHNLTAEYTPASSGENYNCSAAATLSGYSAAKQNQTGFAFPSAGISKVYGDADFTVTASGGQSTGPVTYASSDAGIATVDADTGKVHIKKAGSITIIAVRSADGNYNAATATVAITVGKAAASITALPTAGNITVVGKLSGSALTGGSSNVDGTFAWFDPDMAVTKTGAYEVIFIPKDMDDYSPCTGKVQVTVSLTLTDGSGEVSLDLSGATLPSGVTSVSLGSSQSDTGSTSYTAVFKLISGNAALGNLKNLVLYNLKLLDQNSNPIENFTGKIKVKVKIPSGMSGDLHIYWYDSTDNKLVDMDATQEDDYLLFCTTHFSFYAVAQLGTSSAPISNPKTGSDNWPLIPLTVLGGGSATGIICMKHRKIFRRKANKV